jgi:endoglucanase
MVPVYWDAGVATENHSSGLFNRSTGEQVYPSIIKALVDGAT